MRMRMVRGWFQQSKWRPCLSIVLPKSNVLLYVFCGQKDSMQVMMGQGYQCRWRICRELKVSSRFEYHTFYVLYPFVTYLLILPLTYILQMLGSNLGRATCYPDFWLLFFSLYYPGKCTSLDHYRFLLNSFRIIIHESACHFTLCTLDAKRVLE
jgi:hypothetical protein